jgi:TRAP-type transport system small permease protein
MTPSRTALVIIGGFALLAVVFIDVLAVLGRHLKLPLIGSIEWAQAAVLIAGCVALVLATRQAVHARVHLLLDRMPANWRARLLATHMVAIVVVLAALLWGSAWVMANLWYGHEESEVMRVPYRPLRVVTVLALAATLFAACKAWHQGRKP